MKKTLIVHGDPLITHHLRSRLEEAGLPVATTTSGGEARKIIEEAAPDLVIVDFFLPDSQGLRLLEFLRRGPAPPAIPSVVFVSPLTQFGALAKAAGATHVIEENPADPGAMMAALSDCIGPGVLPAQKSSLTAWTEEHSSVAREQMRADFENCLGNARLALVPLARGGRDLRSLYTFASAIRPIASRAAFAELGGVYRIASVVEALAFECHENPTLVSDSILRAFSQSFDLLRSLLAPENLTVACDIRPGSVYCVEDDPEIRSIVEETLTTVGLKVASASNSREAIAHLDQERADLLFLDIGLPDENGFELCASVRALLFHEKTPIVFLTGRTALQNRAQARLSGGDDFMTKPFALMELALKALSWIYQSRIQQVTIENPETRTTSARPLSTD